MQEGRKHEKDRNRDPALQDHLHAAKDFRRQVEAGNSLLYRLSRHPLIRPAAPPDRGDHRILPDQAAAGAGGRWVFGPARFSGDPAAGGVHPDRSGRELHGCDRIYESLGRAQPAGGNGVIWGCKNKLNTNAPL